jgi:predicted RNase H-like HicB family nuclease
LNYQPDRSLRYPIAIKLGNKTRAFSVVAPDLAGCFSAADDSIDQAIERTKEAIGLSIETALDRNETIPYPSSIGDL